MLRENNTITKSKIKGKISMDLKGMNFEGINEYLKRQSTKLQTKRNNTTVCPDNKI
jgi:hypothetical protein